MNWTPEKIEILHSNIGKLSGPQIGALIGCTGQTVRDKLEALGIKFQTAPRFWTPERLAILTANVGKLGSPSIAKLVGCSPQAVRDKMYRLGLKANRSISHDLWTPEQIAYVREHAGKLSSKVMSEVIGKSDTVICVKIRRLGLIGMKKSNPVDWTPEKLEKLKLLASGVSIGTIAKEIGVGETTISLKARKLGIQIRRSQSWRPHEDELLRSLSQTTTAKEIAAQIGRTVQSVSSRASRLDITLRGRGYIRPKKRTQSRKAPLIIERVVRPVDICPIHRCAVSNWEEHRKRLACKAIPPHLAAHYARACA